MNRITQEEISRRIFGLICILTVFATVASSGYTDEVAEGGQSGNPGMQATVSEKGVTYLNKVAGDAINEAMPNMRLAEVKSDIPNGFIELTDLHVINFRPADSYETQLNGPNQITWSETNMDIGVKGYANGQYGTVKGRGDFDLTAYNADLTLTVAVSNNNGKPQLKIVDCKTKIKSIDMNLYNFQPPKIEKLFHAFRKTVLRVLKSKMEVMLCKELRKHVDSDVNEKLAKMPMKVALTRKRYSLLDFTPFADSSATSASSATSTSTTETRIRQAASNLLMDYGMTKDPDTSNRQGNVYSKGEISWQGQGGTPFYPNPIADSSSKRDRMVYLALSDYTVNSMLYHANKQGLFNLNLNKRDNPEFASLFRSTCNEMAGEMCVGSGFPQLNDQYPNADVEIRFTPSQAPAVIFKPGVAKAYFEGEMKIMAKQRNGQTVEALKTLEYCQADIVPRLDSSNNIKAKVTIAKLDSKLVKTTLNGVDQQHIDSMSKLAKIVLEAMADAALDKGFPLPELEEARMINPKLTLMNRKAVIETDVEANKPAMAKLATALVSQTAQMSEKKSSNSSKAKKLLNDSQASKSSANKSKHKGKGKKKKGANRNRQSIQ